MGGKASVNKVADTHTRTMRSHGSDKQVGGTRPAGRAGPVAPSTLAPTSDAVLDERGGYKMCLAPDTRVYWINKAGDRCYEEPASWRPAKRPSMVQVAPVVTPPFETTIPGTLEDAAECDDVHADHTSEERRSSPAYCATDGNDSLRGPEGHTPLTGQASVAQTVQPAIGEDSTAQAMQQQLQPPLCKEVSIGNILKDALGDATVVVPRSMPPRPSAPSLTKEASIANILRDAVGDDAAFVLTPTQQQSSKALTKEASIAQILRSAVGDDARVTVTTPAQPLPSKLMSKEASIANMLREAVGDASPSVFPTMSSKQAGIANILESVLGESGSPSAIEGPNTNAASLRKFEIRAAVDRLSDPSDNTLQPKQATDVETAQLLNISATRSARRIDQVDGRSSFKLTQTLSTSPSKAVLDPSESQAELDRLRSIGGDTFEVPGLTLPAQEDGAEVPSLAHNAPVHGTTTETAGPTSPIRGRGKRATFNQGSVPLRLDASASQQLPPHLVVPHVQAQPHPADVTASMSRPVRMSIPGGGRSHELLHSKAVQPRQLSLPTADLSGNASADLNRILLETQGAVASHMEENGGSIDVTPPMPKPIPIRNTRASFTRGSQEQAILPTTARLQTSSRTSFRQARLSNADVESLISASRGGGIVPSTSQANQFMLVEQQAARQALEAAKKPLSVSRPAVDGASNTNVVGLMRVSPSKANLLSTGQHDDRQDSTTLQATPSRGQLDPPMMLHHSTSRSFRQPRMVEGGRDFMLQRSATGLRGMSTSPSKAVLVPSESRAELNRMILADLHASVDALADDGHGATVGRMRTSPSQAVLVPSESRAELNRLLLADQHYASSSDDSNSGCIGLMRTSPSKAVLVPSESRAELNRLLLSDQHVASLQDDHGGTIDVMRTSPCESVLAPSESRTDPSRLLLSDSRTADNGGFVGLMRTSPSTAVLVPSDSRAELNRLLLADEHASMAADPSGAPLASAFRTGDASCRTVSTSLSRGSLRDSRKNLQHSPSRSFRQNRTQDVERDRIQRSSTGLRGMLASPSKAAVRPTPSRAELMQFVIDDKQTGTSTTGASSPTLLSTTAPPDAANYMTTSTLCIDRASLPWEETEQLEREHQRVPHPNGDMIAADECTPSSDESSSSREAAHTCEGQPSAHHDMATGPANDDLSAADSTPPSDESCVTFADSTDTSLHDRSELTRDAEERGQAFLHDVSSQSLSGAAPTAASIRPLSIDDALFSPSDSPKLFSPDVDPTEAEALSPTDVDCPSLHTERSGLETIDSSASIESSHDAAVCSTRAPRA
ncbi:hypothetical protein H310_06669 [Aphanomyces invadans]|uniref:Uncharacterized protein n=1 Tax=Aphanomyces invadans TaxID=157072 RepID=A0A024U607_9STRA|nr:hypothetical protein H310_06669 [Aphanomyces invadans]ETW01038.1 hypothetical protein H310_06669 [Aphanomyces invadans]|eukprot:XP_008870036.1 hypothetical protein H310_06669 [Aphanomyces invadans]